MKRNKFFAMLVSLACVTGLVACDDESDLEVKSELQKPAVTQTSGNYEALGFVWDAVPNTIQYGYKLYDPDDIVVEAGVTKDTHVSFAGLKPSTAYVLRVWAFAGLDTDYTTSPAAELVATTGRRVILGKPENLAVTGNDGVYTVSWNAVADAESYIYTVFSSNNVLKTGVVNAPDVTLTISGCGREKDCHITLKAVSSIDGYFDSDEADVDFHYMPGPDDINWKSTGSYTSLVGGTNWDATMIAYVDGTYVIESFYGAEGYDLVFSVDSSGNLVLLCGQEQGDGNSKYWLIPTGIESIGDLYCYIWGGYAIFRGDSTGGSVWLGNYDWSWNFGYDSFVW